ncbi:TrkH family potassium uptake protein [Brevundimonas sp. TWP2-3-4b1]|uniref:TrkH family potassium uptake protein n=1 Tax=Brevundimonas sp. TWP2-3-4b1 TaxID=2804580 RepID=UPI003CFA37FE
MVPLAFLAVILLGTALLSLPWATATGDPAPLLTALFTATSATCVTGLITVDTATYWSLFGQVVILGLFQVGGFGIMTGATLLGLLISRRMKLGRRLIVQAETKSLQLVDVKGVLMTILWVTLTFELAVAVILTFRFRFGYGEPWGVAAWHGVFHSVSAFNNAGFSTFTDNLMGFALDPLVLFPLCAAVIVSGLGFPVINELLTEWRTPERWSIHAKLTLLGTGGLLVLGFLGVAVAEWNNVGTFSNMSAPAKMLNAFTHSVVSRTAGFNTVDVGQMRPETLFLTDGLMLIGGGSAGTAGGIKVTTFLLLGVIVWAEVRGRSDVTAFRRRICPDAQRQALAVVLLAVGLVGVSTLAILSLTMHPLEKVLFEVVSAFATVGMSTGITASLPPTAQLILIGLMFVGRVGTITVAAAMALRARHVPYRYPQERPIVG